MLEQLKAQSELTRTENGALAHRSTGSECLNFFSLAGALRNAEEERIEDLFVRAFAENPDYALRTLFYARDIRGGLGERRLFRLMTKYLSMHEPASVIKNLHLFAEYGRYDDLLVLLDTPCEAAMLELVARQLREDTEAANKGEAVSLMGKWLPSVNASSPQTRQQAAKLAKKLHMPQKEYRKTLALLRRQIDVLERRLCERDYSFEYEKQCSGAMFKYRRAFDRNDHARYAAYIEAVMEGKKMLNASALYPYEIVRRCREIRPDASEQERKTLDATWRALPDIADDRNALVVVDGSGSMYWEAAGGVLPIEAAVSLGIYFAERNKGYFKDHFITFSCTPRLIRLAGRDITERVRYCMSYNECANTDLYEVFMLLLITAVKKKLPQQEMPEMLYIISDMEFDCGVQEDKTVFEDAKEKFEDYGYRLPNVVYWNVSSRNDQFPVRMNEKGAALVSGSSPSVFRMAMNRQLDPMLIMRNVLESERYCRISA